MSANKVNSKDAKKAKGPQQEKYERIIQIAAIAAGVVIAGTIFAAVWSNNADEQAANQAASKMASQVQPVDESSKPSAPAADSSGTNQAAQNQQSSAQQQAAQNMSSTQKEQALDKTALAQKKTVTMNTTKGKIVMEIYPKAMPITTTNFDKLIAAKFYNGLTFHRVEDWVIQGGDPKGNGTGGPGWTIPLETNDSLKNVRGALAMARAQDPNSAGSQFYILKQDSSPLDGQYAVFGKVVQGMDVVDRIEIGDKMISVTE